MKEIIRTISETEKLIQHHICQKNNLIKGFSIRALHRHRKSVGSISGNYRVVEKFEVVDSSTTLTSNSLLFQFIKVSKKFTHIKGLSYFKNLIREYGHHV